MDRKVNIFASLCNGFSEKYIYIPVMWVSSFCRLKTSFTIMAREAIHLP